MNDLVKAMRCIDSWIDEEKCYADEYNSDDDNKLKMICGGTAKEGEIVCPYSQDTYSLNIPDGEFQTCIPQLLGELVQYREIGMVEECLSAVHKQTAMKPKCMVKVSPDSATQGYCPMCKQLKNDLSSKNYCTNCGQKLDWGSEKEDE